MCPSFPFALGIAGSIRVGHLLGGNKPLDAERAARTVLVLTSVGCAILAALYLLTRHYIGAAFTDDAGVVSKVANLVPIAALFQLSDGIQSAIAGVLRGMGRQVRVKKECYIRRFTCEHFVCTSWRNSNTLALSWNSSPTFDILLNARCFCFDLSLLSLFFLNCFCGGGTSRPAFGGSFEPHWVLGHWHGSWRLLVLCGWVRRGRFMVGSGDWLDGHRYRRARVLEPDQLRARGATGHATDSKQRFRRRERERVGREAEDERWQHARQRRRKRRGKPPGQWLAAGSHPLEVLRCLMECKGDERHGTSMQATARLRSRL